MKLALRSIIRIIGIIFLSFLASGCGYIYPQETTKLYSPSDGINVDIEDVKFRNILIVAKEKNLPGRILGTIINESNKEITISIDYNAVDSISFIIPSEGIFDLHNEMNTKLIKPSINSSPGSMLTVKISYGKTTIDVELPIVDGTLHEYAEYLPE